MNHTKGLHHIGFAARNFDQTLRLYTQGFGMTIKHTWGRGETIHMLDMGNGACIELFHQEPKPCEHACWQHITLKTGNIQADFRKAVEAGAVCETEPAVADIPEARPHPVVMQYANLRGYEEESIELIQETESDNAAQPQIGLHHIALGCNHLQETIRFYTEGLGMSFAREWGRDRKITFLNLGDGSCVELFEDSHEVENGGCWLHLALATDDIHASYEQAIAAGAKPLMEPCFADIVEAKPHPVKMWFAYVIGAEGEQIEFIQEECDFHDHA